MSRRRWLSALAVLLFLGHVLEYHGYLLDDAYISLRYARNLVDGHGLVFNPGERVEGYTNFLWVLAGAAFLAAKLDAMVLLAWTSFAAALGLLVIVARLERSAVARHGAPRVALPAVVWILALEGFGYWSWIGMESMVFTALFALAVTLVLAESRDGRWRGAVVVFVLLALTRPDGVVAVGLAIGGARSRPGCVTAAGRGVAPSRNPSSSVSSTGSTSCGVSGITASCCRIRFTPRSPADPSRSPTA